MENKNPIQSIYFASGLKRSVVSKHKSISRKTVEVKRSQGSTFQNELKKNAKVCQVKSEIRAPGFLFSKKAWLQMC